MKAHIARNQNAGVPLALGWNLSAADRGILEGMAPAFGMKLLPVSPADAGKTVAQLLGEVETKASRTLVLEPGAYPPALVLANFKEKDLDTLLDLMKQAQVNIPLKAVVTPSNKNWVFGDLLALSAESAAAETPDAAATPETSETPETPAPVITEPDAVYTYEFSNTTSEVIYGYQATATLGQSVSVPRNGRVVLSGPAGQWQILVGGVWADLAGADSSVALTYALLKNAGSSTRIRCLDAAGNSQG